jgi:hypothetical protein
MNQFKKFYIIALMVIVYSAQESYARKRVIFRRDASNSCRKAYLIARTTEKLCHMDITSLDGYSNDVLSDMCSNSGCMKKTVEAYKKFDAACNVDEVRNKDMLMQHINSFDSIICKKNGNDFCLSKINTFIHSNPQNKKDLGMCENDCISSIYNIVGMGVVSVPTYLRNDIIRANLLCSKVPGKKKYCIDKLEDFRNEKSYSKKMDIYCDSLCVQKVLWRDQSEYDLTYNLNSSPESIISNFTDSACLYNGENRCGEFLLKILNNDYGCSGLRYPRVFPFSGNYTVCNKEIKEIIDEYGTCVNSLFSNKSGDWLNLYNEISRYSKTRRIKNFSVFQNESIYEEVFNRTYKIDNFKWLWYQSNDRAVSVYIINSIAAHLGITPSMISGQGYKEYSVMIKGLTKKQQKELENDKSMSLTMFSGQIDFDALEDPTKGLYISGAFMIIPNMISVFAITVSLLLMLF